MISGPAESYTLYYPGKEITRERYLSFVAEIKHQVGQDSLTELDDHSGYTVDLKNGRSATFSLRGKGELSHVKLTIGRDDYAGIFDFRVVALNSNLRVRHDARSETLPRYPFIALPEWLQIDSKVAEVLTHFDLTLAYVEMSNDNRILTWYGKNSTGKIEIINANLLEFYMTGTTRDQSEEFSYSVVEDQREWSWRYDAGLVPRNFYEYYHRSFKIINRGFFDIDHIDRKVFFSPYVYSIDEDHHNLNTLAGGGMLADKVRAGETLDGAIIRVLREELRLADDYYGALVEAPVTFDRDRHNLLTPHLNIHIYIKNSNVPTERLKQMQRGWRSLGSDAV